MNKGMAETRRSLDPIDEFLLSVVKHYYFNKDLDWPNGDVNWENILAKAFYHGVTPLLYFVTKDNPQLTVPDWVVSQLKNTILTQFYKQTLYQTEIEKLLTYLEERGIEVIVLKGFVLSRLIYPDSVLRTYVDIDLLFKYEDWGPIRAYLLERGFSSTQDLAETLPPKIIPADNFDHELIFYNRSELKFELKLDPFDMGVCSRMIDEIWERATINDFDGFKCRSLSPEHQLLHLLVHVNHHGFRNIKWLTDIALMLTSGASLDWDQIARDAKRDGIIAPVYFSLIQVCKLFDITLDEKILNKLKPSIIKQAVWRSVWPVQDISALKGIEYGALLFPKKIFSKWFIPNILMTGKAIEKTSYFLRRVFPSTDYLEGKYSNGTKRSYAYYMMKRYETLLNPSRRTKTKA